MSQTVVGGAACAFVLALLLAGAATLHGDGFEQDNRSGSARYTFTTVLDSQRDGLDPTRCPAIDGFGTVAVTVRDINVGGEMIITKRHANDEPVIIADTRSVADFPTFCDNGFNGLPSDPSINERGEVAFQGNLRRLNLTTRPECGTAEQRARRQGVFLGDGGPLTTIAHTINQPGGDFIAEFLVADQSVNTSGRDAFVPELDGTFQHGLFVGSRDGEIEQRFLAGTATADGFNFNSLSSRVSLNESGQIAFQSALNSTNERGIFLSEPDGTFRRIATNISSGFASIFDPFMNNLGVVAFRADRFDENSNQIHSINTSRGGPVTTVAESSPAGFASFREPSLNDFGQVVFTADLQQDPNKFIIEQGVFTGPDPKKDKVLQAGDRYEGVRVTSVNTCAEALNNSGQIVMIVHSQNPNTFEVRRFVVKATPRD